MWQQLKTDIETAMAKKPDKESGGQYKRFSVIQEEVEGSRENIIE